MRYILIILFILTFLFNLYSQQYSNVNYDAGTTVEVQLGADVCADDIIINGIFTGIGTLCNGPLPVQITLFNYSVNKNKVILNWVTAWELNNSGFDIERAKITEKGIISWYRTGFIEGNGTVNETKYYSFEDKNLQPGTYKYRLKQIDYNSNYEYFDLMQEVNIMPPVNFFVKQNFPNPSNPKSNIYYEIPVAAIVSIRVYNMLGQLVKTIVNEYKDAGYHIAEFDGTNLPSGVYFYRLVAGNFAETKKMILLK